MRQRLSIDAGELDADQRLLGHNSAGMLEDVRFRLLEALSRDGNHQRPGVDSSLRASHEAVLKLPRVYSDDCASSVSAIPPLCLLECLPVLPGGVGHGAVCLG